METKTKNRTKAWLGVISVFIIGLALGALSMNLYIRHNRPSQPTRHNPLDDWTMKLSLTPEQRQQIDTIFKESFDQFRQVRKEVDPKFEAIKNQSRERIKSALTPEQLPKFEEMMKQEDSRGDRHRGDRGDGPKPK